MNLAKTPYLVLFVILGGIGISAVSAAVLVTIDNLNVTGDLNVDGQITGDGSLGGLSCTPDQVARWTGASWECVTITVKNNPITTVDSTGIVGAWASIAIGTDDNPVISYYDASNGNLNVLHCDNKGCTSGNSATAVDSSGDVGRYTSIVIGTDDNPVISYYDASNDALKILHCGNTSCNSGNTITTLDNNGDVGQSTSIAIGTDNNPVISYHDVANGNLKFVHCGNTSCSSGNNVSTLVSSGDVGEFISIAIGTDNNPVISYYDVASFSLKVLHCGNTSCTSGNMVTEVDSGAILGQYNSIAIGIDGNPVISYFFDFPEYNLWVLHCGNTLCNSGNTKTRVDSTIGLGTYTSIAIGTDNNPVISYHDYSNNDLKVVHCGNTLCNSLNVIGTLDDSTDDVGALTSIAIGADGNPVISYYDATNNDLKIAVDGSTVIFE